MTNRVRGSLRCIVIAVALGWASAYSQVNVLTQHNDAARTGANLLEKQLAPATVKARFGKLWTLFADGQIVAQPLYVSALDVAGVGPRNVVIVATMHNTIYAYDADKPPTHPQSADALLWAQWLGDPRPAVTGMDSWHTNYPEWGIVSTPVIDNARKTLYVVSWHRDLKFRLHAIDLAKAAFPGPGFPPEDYREKVLPVPVIAASIPAGGGHGPIALDTSQQKQRAALLLSNGVLYVAFATNRETDNTLHGWLLAYDAATLKQKAVWNATPTGHNGGIWQAGSGLAADAAGNVILMTGNGSFDADRGGADYGDSFVKLKLAGDRFVVVDYFTPCNQVLLDRTCATGGPCDLDLGSAGPLLMPGGPAGSQRIVGGGKDGSTYLLDAARMGRFKAPPAPVRMACVSANALQVVLGAQQGGPGVVGNIHGSHVVWPGADFARVFVWGEDDNLRSFAFKGDRLATPPAKSLYRIPFGMPGGMLSISADGNKRGSAVLWALVPLNGDANTQRGVRAQLLAFDALDITNDVWRSEPLDATFGPDSVGLFAKFVAPTVANGKVFVATYGDQENPPGPRQWGGNDEPPPASFPRNYYIAVYGLRP